MTFSRRVITFGHPITKKYTTTRHSLKDMTEVISKFLDFTSKYSWAVSITSAFVLFVPESTKKRIGIFDIYVAYKGYIWIIFVLSSVLFFGFLTGKIFTHLGHRNQQKKKEKENKKRSDELQNTLSSRVNSMSEGERNIVAYCLLKGSQSFRARADESGACSLVQRGFARRGSGNIFDAGIF